MKRNLCIAVEEGKRWEKSTDVIKQRGLGTGSSYCFCCTAQRTPRNWFHPTGHFSIWDKNWFSNKIDISKFITFGKTVEHSDLNIVTIPHRRDFQKLFFSVWCCFLRKNGSDNFAVLNNGLWAKGRRNKKKQLTGKLGHMERRR